MSRAALNASGHSKKRNRAFRASPASTAAGPGSLDTGHEVLVSPVIGSPFRSGWDPQEEQMIRNALAFALAVLATLGSIPAQAQSPGGTLVLPFRAVGVSDATAHVSRELLMGSLGDLGIVIVGGDSSEAPLPQGDSACDKADCAAAIGRERGASRVVYGTFSQLGGKIIARLSVVRVDEAAPYYRDQLTATSEEDLDTVMRRFAEGIASGRPNSDRASVESVTQAETITPLRRATRRGAGIRAGFLFPTGNSFGGADRLTNLHGVYRYELGNVQIETSTIVGFSWGDGNFDWTLVDVSAARLFGTQDFTTYLGAGLGVHSVTVERRQTVTYTYPGSPPYTYEQPYQQTETAPTLDLVAGIMALRTYDLSLNLELRFHYVFAKFDEVGGDGANGVRLTFGTSR